MVFFRNRFLFDTALMGARDLPALRANPALVARTERAALYRRLALHVPRAPMIAPVYLQLMAVVGALIAAAFWLLRRLEPARGELRAGFLLLGLGFTLLSRARSCASRCCSAAPGPSRGGCSRRRC